MMHILLTTRFFVSRSLKEYTDEPVSCDDGDLCTIDRPIFKDGVWDCEHNYNVCGPGQSCDPLDGDCKDYDDLVPCVSVIDEDSSFTRFPPNKDQAELWDDFKAAYPSRPFCLLVIEEGSGGTVKPLPLNFTSDPYVTYKFNVTRDGGNASLAENWVDLCGLGSYTKANVQFIGMFIDDSGSMTVSDVQASTSLFLSNLSAKGIDVTPVNNTHENWIYPFMTELVPKPTKEPGTPTR
jgi:hypothetical protein